MSKESSLERADRPRVVLIGGGMTGLSAAARVGRAARVVVIERAPAVGGLARAEETHGYLFDFGPHRLTARSRRGAIALRRKLVDPVSSMTLPVGVLVGGRIESFPPVKDDAPPAAGESLATFLSRRYGRSAYERIGRSYHRKQLGLDAADLSAGDYRNRMPAAPSVQVRYPARGGASVIDGMTASLSGLPVEVILGARVEGLRLTGGRVTSVVLEVNGRTRAVRCDAVIATVPLTQVARWLGLDPPAVSFRGCAVVSFGITDRVRFPYAWIYAPEPEVPFIRVHSPSTWSDRVVPEGCGSIQFQVNTDTWTGGLTPSMRSTMYGFLRRIGIEPRAIGTEHMRFEPTAYPIVSRANVSEAVRFRRQVRSQVANLWVGGRGAFNDWNMEEALVGGERLATAALTQLNAGFARSR